MTSNKVKENRSKWILDPDIAYLNHGSFGATPRVILDRQQEYRRMMEEEPVQFMVCKLPDLLWRTQCALGDFVQAAPEDIVLVQNATEGVNAVLQSLNLESGDEILFVDQVYGACKNTADFVAQRTGAICKSVALPIPMVESDEIVQKVCAAWNERTKLLLLDHICSPSGWVLPIEEIVQFFEERGTPVLVDGAHALGQIPLSLKNLGASFYVANAHKWLCSPKGSAFLYVREDWQSSIRPTCISHGATWKQGDYPNRYSHFQMEFAWTGTSDPTAHLCVPDCIQFMHTLHENGWEGIWVENTQRARKYRQHLVQELNATILASDSFVGHMGSVLLPKERVKLPKGIQIPIGERLHPLWKYLYEEHQIEVVVFDFLDQIAIRFSVQAYVSDRDIERLCHALQL
jgi:isopenicillin-N epimerase